MRGGRHVAELCCGVQHDVELAPALVDHAPEGVDVLALAEVHGDQRGPLAGPRQDLVVQGLQRALGAAHGDHMGPGVGQAQGAGAADPAGGAGDKGDEAVERLLGGVSHAAGSSR